MKTGCLWENKWKTGQHSKWVCVCARVCVCMWNVGALTSVEKGHSVLCVCVVFGLQPNSISFLPFPLYSFMNANANIQGNRKWVKVHFENKLVFRCIWKKTNTHSESQRHAMPKPSPRGIHNNWSDYFLAQTQPSDWLQRKHTNRALFVLPGTRKFLYLSILLWWLMLSALSHTRVIVCAMKGNHLF